MIKWILSSSVLIGAVISLRYLFRGKISAKLQYALWALVLVRLLMPTGMFATVISVENVVALFQSTPVIQNVIADIQTPGLNYDQAYDYAEEQILPDNLQGAPAEKLNLELAEKLSTRTSMLLQFSTPSFVLENILILIWYIGIAVVAITLLVSNIKFSVNLRRKRQLLRDEKPRIYTCEGLDTPCLFGLLRPAIYLTPEDAADQQRSQHIIAHERTHLKHWDHIWSILRCVCLAIHWYNPLVWVAAVLSRQDCELACDEATIQKLGEDQRIPYGQTLIQTTCSAKPTTGILGIATTMTSSENSIKHRILRIAQKRKFNVFALVSIILVGALSIGCTWFGANPESELVTTYLITSSQTTYYPNGHSTSNRYTYDEDFRLTSHTYPAGFSDRYTYDEYGRCTYKKLGDKQHFMSYDAEGRLESKLIGDAYYTYTYDESGRLIQRTNSAAFHKDITTYTYDFFGNLRTSRTEDIEQPGNYTLREYNAQENLTHFQSYSDGNLVLEEIYTYDLFGNLTKHERYNKDNVLVYRFTCAYDLSGRLIWTSEEADRRIDWGNNNEGVELSLITTTYVYDLAGNLVDEIRRIDDTESHTIRRYDIFGNLVSLERGDTRIEYITDGHGNCVAAYKYERGELVSVTTYTYMQAQLPRSEISDDNDDSSPTITAPKEEI